MQKTCNHDEGMSPVAHADDLVCVHLPHSALIQHTDIGFEKMKETAVDKRIYTKTLSAVECKGQQDYVFPN